MNCCRVVGCHAIRGSGGLLLAIWLMLICGEALADDVPDVTTESDSGWTSLFDGQTLGSWTVCRYGGDGEAEIHEGALHLYPGEPITGVHWTGMPFPKVNYELELETQRVSGIDFFLGLTFPVEESCCSLILGGWGGSLTGLSSLNGADASENETHQFHTYEKGRWYKVRIRVTGEQIAAWLDGEEIIEVQTADMEISTRIEMELCKPLGLATYLTQGAFRNIRYRRLPSEEIKTTP